MCKLKQDQKNFKNKSFEITKKNVAQHSRMKYEKQPLKNFK